jgi:hypothetical protein
MAANALGQANVTQPDAAATKGIQKTLNGAPKTGTANAGHGWPSKTERRQIRLRRPRRTTPGENKGSGKMRRARQAGESARVSAVSARS